MPPLAQLLPAEPLLLMTAGPVPVPAEVARAGGLVIDHVGESMNMLLRHIKEMTRYSFQTRDDKILGVSGPASAAMEMAMANLLWPGRSALVLKNGYFSGRFAEMAEGVGASVDVVESPEGKPVTAAMVEERLREKSYDLVTMVQGETSCGVLTAELRRIVELCREHGALTVVDAVCTLSTMPLKKDEWGIEVVMTGSQKGLSSLPGVSLIAFSDAAWRAIEERPSIKPHWCLDVMRAQRFWGEHEYHYTAPVPGLLALHEALRLISEETLERRFERHLHSSAGAAGRHRGTGTEAVSAAGAPTQLGGGDRYSRGSGRRGDAQLHAADVQGADIGGLRPRHRAHRSDGGTVPGAEFVPHAARPRCGGCQAGRQSRSERRHGGARRAPRRARRGYSVGPSSMW